MTFGIYKQTAADIMTKHVATVSSRETVHDALLLMAENRLAALPVVDRNSRCIGMVSQADIIAMAHDADLEDEDLETNRAASNVSSGGVPLDQITHERIHEVMSDSVVIALPDELVTVVADKMIAHEVHHIPVADESGKLLGIVSTIDILRALRARVER
ncbi:MAG: CBS domain-containing protein [Planctomycetales bacterium]|nr:CBS domain-containing protein [Planctomycetales bacterium]